MRQFFTLGLVCVLILSARPATAQHYYYMPNSVLLPVFQQRHDAAVGLGWTRGVAAKAIELQGYYSPKKHIALFASYMNAGEKEVLQNEQEGMKYRFYEIGGGVYESLSRGTASLLAGYGHGDMYNYFQGEEYVDLNIQRLFIQPSILYHDAFFQGGIALRLSHIKFNSGEVAIAIPPSDLQAIEAIEAKSTFFLPEIGVMGGMRLGAFSLNVQVCGIFPRTEGFSFVRLNSSVFVRAELGRLFRGKNKTGKTS